MESFLKALWPALAAALLISFKDVVHRLLMAAVGPKIVEWLVMSALRWLAAHTKSQVDDQLVQHVAEALQGPAADLSTGPQPTEAVAELMQPPKCPACGQMLPPQS